MHQIYGALVQLKAGEKVMSKEHKSNKETKKVPVMTAKKKKAAKKAKKTKRDALSDESTRLAAIFAIMRSPIVMPRGTKRLFGALRPIGNDAMLKKKMVYNLPSR